MEEKVFRLVTELKVWILKREATIKEIKNILEELAMHNKNVKIASISGGSVSLVGSVLCTVGAGLLFSPLAPVGIGLLIGGGVTAGVGGATSLGASITHLIIEKLREKDTKGIIENDAKQSEILCNTVKEIEEYFNTSTSKVSAPLVIRGLVGGASTSVNVGMELLRFRGVLQAAGKTFGQTTKFAVGKIGLGAIGVVLSTVEIGYYAHGLRMKTKTVTEKELKKCVSKLEEELECIKKELDKALSD